MKILLIEDHEDTAELIVCALREHGHQVSEARDGGHGLDCALEERWELLIVDRMLPTIDGLSIVREVRRSGLTTSVLLLTTLSGVDDRVSGLDAGADDYLTKPFALPELIARVAALGRRGGREQPETRLRVADLEMDLLSRSVKRAGLPIDLMPREFRLLEYLMKHTEQVVTRAMLLENVWNVHFDPHTSVVETLVSRLRSKLDNGPLPPLIHTLRGSGYSLRAHR